MKRRGFLALLAAACLGVAANSVLVEPYFALEVSHVKLNIGVKRAVRIVQVTDLHFGSSLLANAYDAVVGAVKAGKPDFIAVTGDLVSKAEAVQQAVDFIAMLSSYAPTYVVPGNWEYYSLGNGVDSFLRRLEDTGRVEALVDRNVEAGGFNLLGVDDPYLGLSNLEEALRGVKEGVKVLLAHSPQIIEEASGKVDVVLAGHTHGGQFCLPLVGPVFIPLPDRFKRYAAGLFKEGGTYLYVCRGIGMSFIPARFMCKPEVAVIDLLPERVG